MEILIRESLTKENFWNEIIQKYPNASKVFLEWINEYKKQSNWGNVLGNKVKFHDLPYAMQAGVWLEYLCNRGGCQFEIQDFFQFDLATDIEETFKHLLEEEATEE
jgi:hypothetical protein